MTTELWIAFAGLMFAILTQTWVFARGSGRTAAVIEGLAKNHDKLATELSTSHEAIWSNERIQDKRLGHHHVRIVRLEDNAGLQPPRPDE